MKTIKVLLTVFFVFSFLISQNLKAQELKYELLCEVKAFLDTPIIVGKTLLGTRTIYPIKGGTVEGQKINGKVLPNGADWLLTLDSTTSKLDVRATMETDDGAIIYSSYSGYIHKNPDNSFYFRTNPIFETSSEKYKWLNYTIAVGVGSFIDGGVAYKIYGIK